ncbi:MAG: hypothetical protein GY810_09840 [Aureispira sp.]|nr:hypothetical protein [Aureispira sp.]
MKNLISSYIVLFLINSLVAQTISPFKNNEEKQASFNYLFQGQWDLGSEEIIWTPNESDLTKIKASVDGKCYTKPEAYLNYETATTKYIVIVFATYRKDENGRIETYHAAMPFISMARYAYKVDNENSGWYLETLNKFINYSGTWGKAPKYDILKIGDFHYVRSTLILNLTACGDGKDIELFFRNFSGFKSSLAYIASQNCHIYGYSDEIRTAMEQVQTDLFINHSGPQITLSTKEKMMGHDEDADIWTELKTSEYKKIYKIDKYGDFVLVK